MLIITVTRFISNIIITFIICITILIIFAKISSESPKIKTKLTQLFGHSLFVTNEVAQLHLVMHSHNYQQPLSHYSLARLRVFP